MGTYLRLAAGEADSIDTDPDNVDDGQQEETAPPLRAGID